MSHLFRFSFLFIFCGSFFVGFAQEDQQAKQKELKRKLTRAELHYENGDYSQALSNYQAASLLAPEKAELYYKQGLCHFKLDQDRESLDAFRKAAAIGNANLPRLHYYLGICLQLNSNFAEALDNYRKEWPVALAKNDTVLISILQKLMVEAESGKELLAQQDTARDLYSISDSINSPFEETSIFPLGDTLLYVTSNKPLPNSEHSENVFVSRKSGERWTSLKDLGRPVNTLGNDAILGYSFKDKTMYLYGDVNGGDIYATSVFNGLWRKPLAFGDSLNSSGMESSMAFNASEDQLIFVSSRAGGKGGKDLYWSYRKANGWSSPVNLGSAVNTGFDEESPFWAGDTLYFASQGHNSMGGFDVFKTWKEKGQWVKPVNLGIPVNGPYDEFDYFHTPTKRYVISGRQGGKGKTDIYEIDLKENRRIKPVVPVIATEPEKEPEAANPHDLVSGMGLRDSIDLVSMLGVNPTFFDFEKPFMSEAGKQALATILEFLKSHQELYLEIRVHTDCRGTRSHNQALSQKRTDALLKAVRDSKIFSVDQIQAVSLGEDDQLVPCDCERSAKKQLKSCTEEDHAKNRRVEVLVRKRN